MGERAEMRWHAWIGAGAAVVLAAGAWGQVVDGPRAGTGTGTGEGPNAETTVFEWSRVERPWRSQPAGAGAFPAITYTNAEDHFSEVYYDAFNPNQPKGCTSGGQPGDTGCAGNFTCLYTMHSVSSWDVVGHGPVAGGYSAAVRFTGGMSTRNDYVGEVRRTLLGRRLSFSMAPVPGRNPLWTARVIVSVNAGLRVDAGPGSSANSRANVSFSGEIRALGRVDRDPIAGDPVYQQLSSGFVDAVTMPLHRSNDVTFLGRGTAPFEIDPGFRFTGEAECPTHDCVRIDGEWQEGDGKPFGFLIGWCDGDGTPPFCGTQSACGGETVGAYPSPGGFDPAGHGIDISVDIRFVGWDCNENYIPDAQEIADGLIEDWDANGRDDRCDIAAGLYTDCNGNDIPDERELFEDPDLDWNANGVHDACDIANGLLADCDGDFVPDIRVLDTGLDDDWNGNGIPDRCDIDSGVLTDCDGDGYPDERLATEQPTLDCNGDLMLDACQDFIDEDGDGTRDWCQIVADPALDCDGNWMFDVYDIETGRVNALGQPSEDCNMNGLIDACEIDRARAVDLDGDGIPDDCKPLGSAWDLHDQFSDAIQQARPELSASYEIIAVGLGPNGWLVIRAAHASPVFTTTHWRANLDTGDVQSLSSPWGFSAGGAGANWYTRILPNGAVFAFHDFGASGDAPYTRLRSVYAWPAGSSDRVVFHTQESRGGFVSAVSDSGWAMITYQNREDYEVTLLNLVTGETADPRSWGPAPPRDISVTGMMGGAFSSSFTSDCTSLWGWPSLTSPGNRLFNYCSRWNRVLYTPLGFSRTDPGHKISPRGLMVGYLWLSSGFGEGSYLPRLFDVNRPDYIGPVRFDLANDPGDNRRQLTSYTFRRNGALIYGGSREFNRRYFPTPRSSNYSYRLDDLFPDDTINFRAYFLPDGDFVNENSTFDKVYRFKDLHPPGVDLNADDLVDDADLLALVTFLSGGPTPTGNPDLNRDGVVDEADAQALAWWLVASRAGTLPDCDNNGVPDLAQLARFGGTLADDDNDLVPDGCVAGCNDADIAPPAGDLNVDDVLAYLGLFAAGESAADLAPPAGVLNIDDVLAFLEAFAAGCP